MNVLTAEEARALTEICSNTLADRIALRITFDHIAKDALKGNSETLVDTLENVENLDVVINILKTYGFKAIDLTEKIGQPALLVVW